MTDIRRPKRPDKPTKTKIKPYPSPDSLTRPPALEREINEAFAVVFRGAASDRVLQYLRSVSTNQVLAPGTDPHTITYHEGARWLMGIIDTRIRHGQEKKP